MSCCACCCFYPKYKRKVDNIYPRSLDAPLIKIELEKLTYYVKQHPEKLSKVGEFLYQHLKWGLTGSYKNRNYVKNTIEAVDKILLVITPQNLNYYAVNYLKIIQKLLEQGGNGMGNASINDGLNNNPASNYNINSEYLEYQKLAASLFRKFCDKEASNQSTTNYNLNYDSFVCQFSSMCYNNNKDENARAEIRSSGLQCLATMVKRLVPDESLSASFIWDNMDKIVPALLFIMHDNYLGANNAEPTDEDEDLNDDDIELDHTLDRYLYGDFFIHSRTNNFLSAEQETLEQDGVKIEFRKQSTVSGSVDKKTGNNATNISASNSDEAGVVFLNPNRKNSVEVVDPDHEAKMLLKNLACKADYTTISKIVLPILNYLDANKPSGWEYSRFVRCVFLILMYNVKQQHAIVIKELIKHLDSHINSSAKLKCHIIRAMSTCIRIAAMHSVGTTGQIIEIFTYLLKHLKSSVEKVSTLQSQLLGSNGDGSKVGKDLVEEQNLQRKIIDAMGQFTANLPDYSKNDVVMFIARQINSQQFNYLDLASGNQQVQPAQQNIREQQNTQLRSKYFECLHEICTKYRPSQLFSAFTSVPFLEDILRLTLVNDWASRRKAHEIIHLLLDKYQFLTKIKTYKPNLFTAQLTPSSSIITIKNQSIDRSSSSLDKQDHEKYKSKEGMMTTGSTSSLNKLSRNQTYLSQLELTDGKLISSREDVQFMRKYGRRLLAHLNENLFLSNNRRENYESIYLTTCLFLVGLYSETEFLVDFVRFGFHVQDLALLNAEQTAYFSFASQCNVHKFVCAYFLMLSKSSGIPALYAYCSEMCDLRRKKHLFHYIYPEYILMNSATAIDSGVQSQRASISEIENDFKRELKDSAKEYSGLVKRFEEENSKAEDDENSSEGKESKENLTKSNSELNKASKLASWLFNKKQVGDILESAGFATEKLYEANSEYSLSVNYLQHHVTSLQTALKFRSPYSNSVDSFSNLPTEVSANFGQANSGQNGVQTGVASIPHSYTNNNISEFHSRKHSRGFSHGGHGLAQTGLGPSSSTHQLGSTPRRSIDIESNLDGDDTSYDSTSQYSMDQNNVNYDQDKLFYIDPTSTDTNQLTVTSSNFPKAYQDLNSFETIRRVLLNGNSNATSAGGSLVNGHATSISSSMNNRSYSQYHHRQQTGINEVSKDDDQNSNQSDQAEKSLRIISDFKQKTFDEQKQTMIRTNQASNEKYQQVVDFISKELIAPSASSIVSEKSEKSNVLSTSLQVVATSQPLPGKSNLVNGNSSESTGNMNNLNDNANSSTSLNSTPPVPGSYQIIPLNDIEFPKLFMY